MQCPRCGSDISEFDVSCSNCKGLLDHTQSQVSNSWSPDNSQNNPQNNAQIGHYQIQEKLGQGGMGAVYKAMDQVLKRQVAIKLMTAEVMSDEAYVELMIREARAASALNHPNIVTIYDVARGGECNYITMELVEGLTLKDLLKKKALSLPQALTYAAQIASGLAAAHEKGIIHRDIKPHNIMIDERDQARILDFGVAKTGVEGLTTQASPKPASHDTQRGQLKGTLAYMSPEQARGKPVQATSDIFSFGILLYFMVTRVHPFEGRNATEFRKNILRGDPEPLNFYIQDAPPPVQELINNCLKKDPGDRIQSMAHVEEVLQSLLLPKKPHTIKRRTLLLASITVAALLIPTIFLSVKKESTVKRQWVQPGETLAFLPFRDLHNDASLKILGMGMSRDVYQLLTNMVQQKSGIWVPAEEDLFGNGTSVQDLKDQVGAQWVITGNIQSFGQETHCSLTLVETASLRQVSGVEVSFELDQVHLARQKLNQALTTLIGLRPQTLSKNETPRNANAYREYLAGLFYQHKGGEQMLATSLNALGEAMARDGAFKPALLANARVYLERAEFYPNQTTATEEWFAKSDSLISQDILLQVRLMGLLDQPENAILLLNGFLEENPNHVDALRVLALFYTETGSWREARDKGLAILQILPQHLDAEIILGELALRQGNESEAKIIAARILERAPLNDWAYDLMLED